MTEPTTAPVQTHWMSNKVYTFLKFVALVLLPALVTLYLAISGLWGLPDPTKVAGSIAAVDTFLGVLLGISTVSYNNSDAKYDGTMLVSDTPTKTTYSLELKSDPADLANKDQITLDVQPAPVPPASQ